MDDLSEAIVKLTGESKFLVRGYFSFGEFIVDEVLADRDSIQANLARQKGCWRCGKEHHPDAPCPGTIPPAPGVAEPRTLHELVLTFLRSDEWCDSEGERGELEVLTKFCESLAAERTSHPQDWPCYRCTKVCGSANELAAHMKSLHPTASQPQDAREALQERDRQWCEALAKIDVAARAEYGGEVHVARAALKGTPEERKR